MISRDFPRHAVEDVLFESSSLRVGDPAYRAAIRDVLSRIQATGRVTQIQSLLDPRFANQVSATRHAGLLQFRITGSVGDSATRVVPVLAAVRAAAAAHPQVRIAETGDASINKAINDTVLRDLHRAELLSFPITLVVLLIAFGAVVAALLPLGLATMAILAAGALVAFTSRLSEVTVQANSVMLLIGLAVGVDYSMFYVKRQREERAAGRPVLDAIETAAATSGRSVLISGLTVLLAMSGMFLTGSRIFYGIGQATMLVVAVAVIGSLTLLPALLGDLVDRGRLPLAGRARRTAGQSRVWTAVLDRVLARPALTAIVTLFQWGWGQSLLGFTSVHSVASWLPLFLFVALFGLSMDYHVFILSRIREGYDRTGRTDQAVMAGVKTTAGVVTAAAVVMVFVFLTFATLSMIQLKEMGVGLAVAVLLDATVVRAVLLPATMKLLGPRNWYLPRWLGWLPRPSRPAPSQARRPVTTAGRR